MVILPKNFIQFYRDIFAQYSEYTMVSTDHGHPFKKWSFKAGGLIRPV